MAAKSADEIRSWLEGQGYPLELRVAQLLRLSGFGAYLGTYYEDADTSTRREIDIVGFRAEETGSAMLSCDVVVECKRSVDAPWIVFRSDPKPSRRMRYTGRLYAGRMEGVLAAVARRDDFDRNLLVSATPFGHGMARATKDRPDVPYEALMTVVKAAVHSFESNRGMSEAMGDWHALWLPVVVVDGQLFEAAVSDSGDLVVEEVSRSKVSFRRPVKDRSGLYVDVVAASDIGAYINELRESFLKLVSACREPDSALASIVAPRSGAG